MSSILSAILVIIFLIGIIALFSDALALVSEPAASWLQNKIFGKAKLSSELLVGKTAKAICDFKLSEDCTHFLGRVQVENTSWKAITNSNKAIKSGDLVLIDEVNSITLTVSSAVNRI